MQLGNTQKTNDDRNNAHPTTQEKSRMPAGTPAAWKTRTALQQPQYDEPAELESVISDLSGRPPLVTSWEVERLKSQLALASCGDAFLLQGGDCNESFQACRADPIEKKLKVLLGVLCHAPSVSAAHQSRL
mgnify:CR=1 FL=1